MFSIHDVKFVLNFTRECLFSRFERSETWHHGTTVDDGAHVVYDVIRFTLVIMYRELRENTTSTRNHRHALVVCISFNNLKDDGVNDVRAL